MLYNANVTVCSEIHTKTHKCNVISMQNFLILSTAVRKVTGRLLKVKDRLKEQFWIIK